MDKAFVIRRCIGGWFYSGEMFWTREFSKAKKFNRKVDAFDFINKNLRGEFNSKKMDFTIAEYKSR